MKPKQPKQSSCDVDDDLETFDDIHPLIRSGMAFILFLRFGGGYSDDSDQKLIAQSYARADAFLTILREDLTGENVQIEITSTQTRHN